MYRFSDLLDFVLSKDKQPACMCQVRGLREFINCFVSLMQLSVSLT